VFYSTAARRRVCGYGLIVTMYKIYCPFVGNLKTPDSWMLLNIVGGREWQLQI
jgi:hypothetical protein